MNNNLECLQCEFITLPLGSPEGIIITCVTHQHYAPPGAPASIPFSLRES